MAIKIYTKNYVGMFPKIFSKKARFLEAVGGTVQVLDGIRDSDEYLNLKVSSDVEAVLQAYSTDENTAFGTGTSNGNRFGNRTEIKSVNKQVKFDSPLAIHEGIDSFTVNDVPEEVVAERLAKHAEAWTEKISQIVSKLLSDSASKNYTGSLNEENLIKVFNNAHKDFVNNGVNKDLMWVAYVNTDVYNTLVDAKLTTTAKQSGANVDDNILQKFKGFTLVEVPDAYFQTGEQIVFTVYGVAQVGLGVQISRTMDSESFAGIVLQAAGKPAKYIPETNVKAVAKATLTPVL